jgi:hypothetical protein
MGVLSPQLRVHLFLCCSPHSVKINSDHRYRGMHNGHQQNPRTSIAQTHKQTGGGDQARLIIDGKQ